MKNTFKKIFAAAMITVLGGIGATNAADPELCYESVFVAAHTECNNSTSNSADFTSGCRLVPQGYVQTPVACPPTGGEWVNIPSERIIHGVNVMPEWVQTQSPAQVCASKGMALTTIDGAMCASGSRRPLTGINVDAIDYGGWGRSGPSNLGGGTFTAPFVKIHSIPTMLAPTYEVSGYYCHHSVSDINRSPRFNNGTGATVGGVPYTDIAVAVACK